jgi:transcriptional regulator with XRE-family HTH domain
MEKNKSPLTRLEFRAKRKELGISVKDFAEFIGKEKTTVYKWEKGLVPLPKYAEILLDSFCDKDWLLRLELISEELVELRKFLIKSNERRRLG